MKQSSASRKINETARSALAQLLLTEFSDPRLALLTVTEVQVSKDRSVAQVFVSGDAAEYQKTVQGLQSAKGRLRTLLGRELGWRVTPELRFVIDTGVDHAQKIEQVLRDERRKLAAMAGSADDPDNASAGGQAPAADPKLGEAVGAAQTVEPAGAGGGLAAGSFKPGEGASEAEAGEKGGRA